MKIHLAFLLTPDLRTDSYKSYLHLLSHDSIYQKICPYQLSSKYSDKRFTINPIKGKHDPGFNLRTDLYPYYYTKGFDITDTVQFILQGNRNSVTPQSMSSYLKDLLELL